MDVYVLIGTIGLLLGIGIGMIIGWLFRDSVGNLCCICKNYPSQNSYNNKEYCDKCFYKLMKEDRL